MASTSAAVAMRSAGARSLVVTSPSLPTSTAPVTESRAARPCSRRAQGLRRRSATRRELGVEEADELTVAGDELVERAGLDDAAVGEDDDAGRPVESAEAVAEQQGGATAAVLEDGVHD